jgi:hypothetical protein
VRPVSRCRLSEAGKRGNIRRYAQTVEGTYYGETRGHGWAKVIWDGTVTMQTYHPDFIELLPLSDGEAALAPAEDRK